MKQEKFPITRKAFFKWLAAKPKAHCNTKLKCCCPIINAVWELTGQLVYVSVFASPQWIGDVVREIDSAAPNHRDAWKWSRGRILRLLTEGK